MLMSALLFLLIFVACVAVSTFALMMYDRTNRGRRSRLMRAAAAHPGATSAQVRQRLAESASEAASAVLKREKSGVIGVLEQRLRAAGLSLSAPAGLLLVLFLSVLSFLGLMVFAAVPAMWSALIAIGAGWMLLNVVLDILRLRRVRQFTEALPDCLDVFARGLRAGQPLGEALGLVANHSKGIAQEEFLRCREEYRMGMALDEALSGMADRITSPEARFIAVATGLQAETGGNLIETLENLAMLLRDRRKLRKKAAALSAETRVSAVILSGLPFAVGGVIFFMNPNYLSPLIEDPRGRILGILGLLSLSLGIASMYKLSRIDV
ncbi:MAG: pilus assembly protein TadB [Rhodobacteraceae bacterium]|nr:MAG: pilus assembly protein TadB [Paracoccaceae bacterium]